MSSTAPEADNATFVEEALRLSGKTAEESSKTGAVDRADEQVDALYAHMYQTTGSPVYRAVWDSKFPVELFESAPVQTPPQCQAVMDASLDVVRRHKQNGTLRDAQNKVSAAVLNDLAQAGYWGLLVDQQYGGQGTPFAAFARFLTRMACIDASVAGLASVHGCIGAVDPLRTFGTEDQKQHHLPLLASGKRLSGFALTEPCAGSDLTALRTRAELDGDDYVVNGEKLFITNAVPGSTIAVVCLIDDRPAVLIVDLPDAEDDQFQLVMYGLHALKPLHNNGLLFRNFRVPKQNLLTPSRGDGLTIAYHGLNRGRIALCAGASGNMRVMLANMLPWARHRRTYGAATVTRELVQRRIGRMAALIVGCDALTDWCGRLLDEGYRGEMECTVAKVFGSESQKEAAIELFMKTHGGRAFLHGHMFGDDLHEFLAPCIYEGEGEMLGLGFLKSLIKEHGRTYYEPIGKTLAAAGLKKPNPLNPLHAWTLRKALVPYMKWRVSQQLGGWSRAQFPSLPSNLAAHADFAAEQLQRSRLTVDNLMRTHQLNLADRQCAMSALSTRIQNLVLMVAVSLWAGRQKDEVVRAAADILCRDIRHSHTGAQPSNSYYRAVTQLGATIADGGFKAIAGIDTDEILMNYEN